ncbi:unnamed protein product [Notodromas monacha]|uniref:Exportin-2 central domain-containing protein n=1 Tax=Notodromas monacha TaxID=399045 RepID=A0A7R9GJG5_9CRUS|nr:unnamed protein product [Notodromas monacha]CAG0922809.1 unnamed protein product [Notodromas monacha]
MTLRWRPEVIIPNMEFRPGDRELFEDSPEDYIRHDVEGSDMETRRRAACELVRALSMFFETKITGRQKKSGVTKANALVDIKSFFSHHILPELADAQVDAHPVLKADTLQ